MIKSKSLQTIFEGGTSLRFGRNDIIVRPENASLHLYFIVSGFVKSYGITRGGNTNMHIIRSKGGIFPLISAFSGVTRDIYFAAMNDVVVQKLTIETFVSKIGNDPDMLRKVIHELSDLYLLHAQRVDTLELRTAQARVISYLLNLADRFGIKKPHGTLIHAPIHHHDIADSASMTRETASREISKLEKSGLLAYDGPNILINDLESLKDLL